MADYITLLGVEQVQSAANTMMAAAREMQAAANSQQWANERHERAMNDWLDRFELIVQRLIDKDRPDAPKQ